MESSPKAILIISYVPVQMFRRLTKLNDQSFFRFLVNSECDDDTNAHVLYLEWYENEKT
jgi:hypothetical protein